MLTEFSVHNSGPLWMLFLAVFMGCRVFFCCSAGPLTSLCNTYSRHCIESCVCTFPGFLPLQLIRYLIPYISKMDLNLVVIIIFGIISCLLGLAQLVIAFQQHLWLLEMRRELNRLPDSISSLHLWQDVSMGSQGSKYFASGRLRRSSSCRNISIHFLETTSFTTCRSEQSMWNSFCRTCVFLFFSLSGLDSSYVPTQEFINQDFQNLRNVFTHHGSIYSLRFISSKGCFAWNNG